MICSLNLNYSFAVMKFYNNGLFEVAKFFKEIQAARFKLNFVCRSIEV